MSIASLHFFLQADNQVLSTLILHDSPPFHKSKFTTLDKHLALIINLTLKLLKFWLLKKGVDSKLERMLVCVVIKNSKHSAKMR